MNPSLISRVARAVLPTCAALAVAAAAGVAHATEALRVAPPALLAHLQTHDNVVVYFTSPDPACGFCGAAADKAFADAAALLDNDVSVVRVDWTPWSQLPPDVKLVGVSGVPWVKVFKSGVQVAQLQGRVTDPQGFAAMVRTGLRQGTARDASGAAAGAGNAWPKAATGAARGRGADIAKVAPAALRQHLKTHDKVVVYFTSPDPRCTYCAGTADGAFALVAASLDRDVSVVRVEWTPWTQFPPEVRALRVTGIPTTKVFKGGVQVAEVSGRVDDIPRFAESIRAGLLKVPTPASAVGMTAAEAGTQKPFGAGESITATGAVRPVRAADFGWDLSYRRVLDASAVAPNEFVREWLGRYPTRPVHDRFANYAGEPIVATLLIELPDGHAGDPMATWIVRTRDAAGLCNFHPKRPNAPCVGLPVDRADAFMRASMVAPPRRASAVSPEIGKQPDGSPVLFGFVGFMSVWVDGRSMQRPIRVEEVSISSNGSDASSGPLSMALQRLTDPEAAPAPSTR